MEIDESGTLLRIAEALEVIANHLEPQWFPRRHMGRYFDPKTNKPLGQQPANMYVVEE